MVSAQFRMQFASDVIRNGMGIELVASNGDVAAEVFRSDSEHTVALNVFDPTTPDAEIRRLVEAAVRELGAFEDGTELSKAANYGLLIERLRTDA
jgi:hypothetical protein